MKKTAKKWIRNPSDDLAVAQGCYFDPEQGQLACDFIETFCRQSKGRWAGSNLVLLEWQRDFIMRVYGWRTGDGKRRFRSVYLEVAKKNGKSTLISSLATQHILDPNDGAPEIYLNAVDREQASIVFDEAARMVSASPDLSARLQVIKSKGRIVDPVGNGKIQKNSADAPSKDGVNASLTIFDEIHRFKNRDLWDVFKYAGLSRDEPLKIIITTAGEEEEGVWFEQRDYSEKVNQGIIPDITHLGIIYRADPKDDIESPKTWRKANPSLGHTLTEADFRQDLDAAKNSPAEMSNFLRLRLNIVARGDCKFIDMTDWDACDGWASPDVDEPCYMGLDLSDRDDLTALTNITGSLEEGFIVQTRFWLPEDNIVALEKRHGVPYRAWADEGYIFLTDGNSIDYDFVEQEIVKLASDRNLQVLFSDPWNAKHLAERLLNHHGLPVQYLRQGYASISDPTKALHGLIKSRRLRHGGHPILRWHASNAVVRKDPAGNIKLDKEKSKKKIDGLAALVNAVAGPLSKAVPEMSVYDTQGIFVV